MISLLDLNNQRPWLTDVRKACWRLGIEYSSGHVNHQTVEP